MPDTDMQKLGSSDEVMFGPRGVIAYGFKVKERSILIKVLKRSYSPVPPILFPTDIQAKSSLEEILALEDRAGRDVKSSVKRAVILSGATEYELHAVMKQYKKSSLDRPFWATVTPTSIEWPLEELLDELLRERQAFQKGA